MSLSTTSTTLRLYGAVILFAIVSAATAVWLYTSYEDRKEAAALAALQKLEAERHAGVERFVQETMNESSHDHDSNPKATAAKAPMAASMEGNDVIEANQRSRRAAKY